jgi:hypothetical protein
MATMPSAYESRHVIAYALSYLSIQVAPFHATERINRRPTNLVVFHFLRRSHAIRARMRDNSSVDLSRGAGAATLWLGFYF